MKPTPKPKIILPQKDKNNENDKLTPSCGNDNKSIALPLYNDNEAVVYQVFKHLQSIVNYSS
jgi:hypothetical protein